MSIIDSVGGMHNTGKPANYYNVSDKIKDANQEVGGTDFQRVMKSTKVQQKFNKSSVDNLDQKSNTILRNGLSGLKFQDPNTTLAPQKMHKSNMNGTDVARMKDVSRKLETQFNGLMWAQMAKGVNANPEGGFGEEIFQQSLWPELVEEASGDELGELGQAIFRDLLKENERQTVVNKNTK